MTQFEAIEVRDSNKPRIICYQQTHFYNDQYISMLPLLNENTAITHVIIAAIHLNTIPGDITLNDDPYHAPKNTVLWGEVRQLQQAGVKVLGMLGGAAKGSYARLDTAYSFGMFDAFYEPLRRMILATGLQGLDLDVEEYMSLEGIINLIDRLKVDFGDDFIITLAPIATALSGGRNLSGFDYHNLEDVFGESIAWYNAQFYCNHGSVESTRDYDAIIARGWNPNKVVLGLSTNPESAQGWVPDDVIGSTLLALAAKYPSFGGVMGWEYFNSITVAEPFGWPWCWAKLMTRYLRG